jgi:peroxiredoxin
MLWLAAGLAVVGVVAPLTLQLRGERAEHRAALQGARHLQPGSFVPPLASRLLDGTPAVLAAGGDQHQLLFIYNTTCTHCLASLPAWRKLTAAAQAAGSLEVLGLSTDPPEEARSYEQLHGLPFASISLQDARYLSLFRARLVPQVAIVDGGGRVVYSRLGRLESTAAVDSVLSAIRAVGPRAVE